MTNVPNFHYRDAYNSGLNLESMTNLLQRLKDDESFFQEYYRRMWVNIGTEFMTGCDEDCMKKELCMIEYPRNDELMRCQNGATNIHSTFAVLLTAFVAFVSRHVL